MGVSVIKARCGDALYDHFIDDVLAVWSVNMLRSVVLCCLCVLVAGPAGAADLKIRAIAPQVPAATPSAPMTINKNVTPLGAPAGMNLPNTQPLATPALIPPMNLPPASTNNNLPSMQPAPTAIGNQMQAIKAQVSTVDNVGALRADNEQLKAKVKSLSQQLTDMKYDKPYCSDAHTVSSKDKTKQWDCGANACNEETGACFMGCNSSDECVGVPCDLKSHTCGISSGCAAVSGCDNGL